MNSESFGLERLTQLMEALPVGVFILAADGSAVYANRTAQALLGRGIAADDQAHNLGERYAAYRAGTNDLYPTSEMPIVRALSGERTTVDDMEIERNGQRIALEVTATPIVEDSTIVFAVAVFQDITSRKQAQRALASLNDALEREVARRTADLTATIAALERANQARSLFLMNVSHELRTPLHQIIGFNDLLTERITEDRIRRLAENARTSGHDLLEKVDALIELARADAPQAQEPAEFDLHGAVVEIATSFGIRCEYEEPLGRVRGIEQVVRQIVYDVCRATVMGAVLHAKTERLGRAARLHLRIEDETLAKRVQLVATVFGESLTAGAPGYQQQPIDLRLAAARTQARKLGGELQATPEGAAVEVCLSFHD